MRRLFLIVLGSKCFFACCLCASRLRDLERWCLSRSLLKKAFHRCQTVLAVTCEHHPDEATGAAGGAACDSSSVIHTDLCLCVYTGSVLYRNSLSLSACSRSIMEMFSVHQLAFSPLTRSLINLSQKK